MNIFEIFGKFAIDNSEVNRKLDETNDKASQVANDMKSKFESIGTAFTNLGNRISSIGTVLTATLSTTVSGLIMSGIKYNAQMEQYEIGLTTLTGSAQEAEKIMEQIKADAAATPFDVAGLTQVNNLLMSTGLSASESRETMLALGNAVSASGGGNAELTRMAVNLQQIKNTGKATALDIKQFAYAGIDIFGILADYTGKTKAEVQEMDITWELLNGALIKASQEGGRYFGAMANQSESVNGKISTLKDNFSNLLGILTESLLPTVHKIIDKAIELTEKFSNLSQEQKEQVLRWAGIAVAIGPVLTVVGKLVSGFGGLVSSFGGVAGGIAKLVTKNGGLLASFSKLFGGMTKVLNPLNLIKGAVAGVKGGFAKLIPSVASAQLAFSSSGGGLSGVLSVAKLGVSGLGSALGGLVAAIGPVVAVVGILAGVFVVLKDNWDKVVEVFKGFVEKTGLAEKFEEIKSKIQPLVEKLKGLKDLFTAIGTVVITLLIPTIATIAGCFNGVISAISPLIDAIGGIIDILAGLGTFIVGVFTGDMDKAGEGIKKFGTGIVDLFSGLWNAVVGFLGGFLEGIAGFMSSLFDTLGITDFLNSVGSAISEWWSGFVTNCQTAWTNVCNFFSSIPTWIDTNIIQPVIGFFTNLWNGIKAAWDKICFVVDVAIRLIASILDAALQIILLPFTFIWENCKEYVFAAWEWIKEKISAGVNAIKGIVQKGFELVRKYIIDPINNAKEKAIASFNMLKAKVEYAINLLKGYVSLAFNWIKEKIVTPIVNAKNKVVETFNEVKTKVSNKINEIKTNVTNTFNTVKEKITTPINNAKTKVTETFDNIKNGIKNKINSAKTSVTTTFNKIKTAITKPIEKARDTVKKVVDKIKGFFKFKVELPKIKLPHFSITPKGWEIGDLMEGSIPKLGIEWYAKAMDKGMVLDEPTIFGLNSNGNLMGAGEAGSETIVGTNSLMSMIKSSIASRDYTLEVKLDTLIELLSKYLPILISRQICLDSGVLVGELAPLMDVKLGDINIKKGRGR